MAEGPPQGGTAPAPGWYRDPSGEHAWRWWDGSAWTTHVSGPIGPRGPSPGQLLESERRMELWAKLAVIAYVFVAAVNALVIFSEADQWRAFLHGVRLAVSNSETVNYAAAPASGISVVVLPISIAAMVLFLVFQYRAALCARALGYEARRSPVFGVWSWFIPVVALWMPYQALRDLLPINNRERAHVLAGWLAFIASQLLNLVLIVSLEADVSVRTAVLLVDLLDLSLVAFLAVEVLNEIVAAHQHDAAAMMPDVAQVRPSDGGV